MIGNLKSTFFKTEMIFDRAYVSYVEALLLEGEELEKFLSPYKSYDVIAWFTNKRIIFTSSPADINTAGKTTEIEFLPYKSIQRYMLLDANSGEEYKVDVFVSDKIDFSFFMESMDDAKKLLEFIANKCGC